MRQGAIYRRKKGNARKIRIINAVIAIRLRSDVMKYLQAINDQIFGDWKTRWVQNNGLSHFLFSALSCFLPPPVFNRPSGRRLHLLHLKPLILSRPEFPIKHSGLFRIISLNIGNLHATRVINVSHAALRANSAGTNPASAVI